MKTIPVKTTLEKFVTGVIFGASADMLFFPAIDSTISNTVKEALLPALIYGARNEYSIEQKITDGMAFFLGSLAGQRAAYPILEYLLQYI